MHSFVNIIFQLNKHNIYINFLTKQLFMAWFFKRNDKGNNRDNMENKKNTEPRPEIDRQKRAFDALAEEFETDVVKRLAKEEGVVDEKSLQKLKEKKNAIKEKIFYYVTEMVSFSMEYAKNVYEEGNMAWNGIAAREEYASSGENKEGELHKAVFLLALNKIAEKGYEAVEKEKNKGTANVLEYYLIQLEALLGDEHTIKYERPGYMMNAFYSSLKSVFSEIERFGLEKKTIPDLLFWYLNEFTKEYGKICLSIGEKKCGEIVPKELLTLIMRTMLLGAKPESEV